MAVWFFSGQRLGQEAQGQGAAPDDGQADDCADAHGAQRLQGRGQRRGGQEPALPLRHVGQDGLQLEVRADDPADVENLVAVPCEKGRSAHGETPWAQQTSRLASVAFKYLFH